MSIAIQADTPPLRVESDGAIRVGNSRVLLEILLASYQSGLTPEEIVRDFPTLALPDVYAAIAYYLRHKESVDEYLHERAMKGDEMQERAKTLNSKSVKLAEIRSKLAARRAEEGN